MRKVIFSALAALAAFGAFGKGATQEWVRRQLAAFAPVKGSTNISVSAAIPASLMGEDCVAATADITASVGSHEALKVVESTVSEIPVGTFYARDAHGLYQNAKNGLLPTIYATPYTIERTTTNALGAASTSLSRMGNFWAVDSTGKAWRMGIGGDTFLYCQSDRKRYIAIRTTTIPERAASVLLPSKTARLSVRAMLSIVLPAAHAAAETEKVYTINSETTYSIGVITFTRTNKRGQSTTITFTPKDLQGVYKGPNGPFKTKEEAYAAAKNLDNWDFGDWENLMNAEGLARMTREDFENSDVWKYLIEAIGTENVEVEVPTPEMPAHPCPAPDDYWLLDTQKNEWYINPSYGTEEELDRWRGANGCKCAVVGCPNEGTAKHRVGRVTKKGGETHFTDDADGGDGCKCCIRCVLYGADESATIIEFNDHRAAGVDAGSCGCACEMYTVANENEWPRDFHNRPSRVGGKDFACLCYCGKAKAANGEYVQHIKYRGDSPWCDKICSACEMVEDEEKYIPHNYPAFDTRHVTLRAPEWNDHTARKETTDPVGMPNDPTYYDRCGCACGAYDESKSSGLPAEFAAFHQQKMGSCRCHCGQTHTKNKRGDETVEPFPCPEICAVCFKVEDKESDAVFTFNGEQYKKLVLIDPTEEKHHAAHEVLCGCKCYNEVTTRHEWSIGGVAKGSIETDGTLPDFHVENGAGCGCECGGVVPSTLPKEYHHGESAEKGKCYCECGAEHLGEWLTKSCGVNTWRECSIVPEHIHEEDTVSHEYANSFHSAAGHYCKCDKKQIAPHQSIKQKSGRGEGVITYRLVCQTPGCGWFGDESEVCNHPNWGEWFKAGEVAGGFLMRRNCADCASFEEQTIEFSGLESCRADMNIHLPLEDTCGCKCGHYGVRIAEEEEFHKWDGDNCRCFCESKHHFKDGSACAKVCAGCKTTLKSGATAKESDHTPASGHVCGCACGYYGVTSEHSASGHYAETAYLHKQASAHGNGIPSFCQCYGAEGTGGFWHWRTARSQTCPRICTYKRGDIDPLGHLAARSSPEKGITPAKPEDHAAKTYGCGCKCGLCDDKNRGEWIHQKTLHHAAQNAEDQCHCACESRELVGKTEGHTFKTCICTCKEKHDSKNYPLNACGYCSSCGYIWRNGVRLDAGNRNNHLWVNGGCYCDGGCVVGGVKMLHTDGHRYMKNKCICLCGEATRDHILVEQKERVGQWTCWKCNAVFLNFRVTTVCSRCEATVSTEHIGSVGEHNPGCGEPKPSCWKCGCHCTTWGTHATCNGHYCNACCTKKPPKPPRPPKPDPDDPDPDEPEPEPPEPYVTCKHPRTETHDWDYHWTCEECSNDFHNWGWRKHCADCGAYIDSESHNEGKHGPPCNGEAPAHECVPSLCGEALNDGDTCQEYFCHECGSCPNTSQHANHHGGNGGTGGGGLNDI